MNDEIAVFQPDAETQIVTRFDGETFWLTQRELCALFGVSKSTISEHLKNAQIEELRDISVVRDFRTTAADGKTYTVNVYNLDAVLSVGYRVKSPRGVQFRRWANTVIKERILRRPEKPRELAALEERVKKLENAQKPVIRRRFRDPNAPRAFYRAKDFALEMLMSGQNWSVEEASRRFNVCERQVKRYLKQLGWGVRFGLIVPFKKDGSVAPFKHDSINL